MGFKLYLFGFSLAVFLARDRDDDIQAELVDDHGDTKLADSNESIPMGFAPSK